MKSNQRKGACCLNRIDKDSGRKNFLLNLVKSSIILGAIDRFTAYIYSLLKNGLFGYIFSGYKNETRSGIGDRLTSTKLSHHLGELRYGICRLIEESVIIASVDRFAKYLLRCRLKVYGVFLMSFGAYTAVITAINTITANETAKLFADSGLMISLVLVLASLPLVFSQYNLSEALVSSKIGLFILRITGFNRIAPGSHGKSAGHTSVSFILGVGVAIISHVVAPQYNVLGVLGCIAALLMAYLVLLRPEIGVCSVFFLMPFLPTMVLAAIVVYTFFCWMIKVLRGKRVMRLEPLDIVVMVFAVLLLSGGFISLSAGSLKPSLLMVCLICGYFLVVQLITNRDWLVRCSVSTVLSGAIVALYGIAMYYTGSGYYSAAWLDDEMFGGIANRAVSTLENPNMLGEYLIIVIPIAIAMFIGRGEGMRKMPTFACICLLGVCLMLTWSRGAWLALIVALIAFILMWHHRSIWLIILGLSSIPILPSILPASIISRFASIGNMADSSTSYRVYIWRASIGMLRDNCMAGIGIGEDAWRRLYPMYSYMGIEAAPHSHNLFIQIWLELGVFGIIAFAVFILLLIQAAFTLFRRLSSNNPIRTPDLSESIMRFNKQNDLTGSDAQRISKIQLRMSVIGPLTGIIAVLIQGITDYSWYNYRLYLFFWLIAGLCSAYIRNGNSFLYTSVTSDSDVTASDARIPIKNDGNRKKNIRRKNNERT